MKRRLTALLLVLLCLPLTACQKQQNLYSATWFDLFDTVAIVQGYVFDEPLTEEEFECRLQEGYNNSYSKQAGYATI